MCSAQNLEILLRDDISFAKFHDKEFEVLLLLPVLNEADRLTKQLEKLSRVNVNLDFLVIDGGSYDDTLKLSLGLLRNCIGICKFEKSQGLSEQLRYGIAFAKAENYKFLIIMDGNNKDDPKSLDDFISTLEKGADFVQGSRFLKGGKHANTPWLRYFGIKLLYAPLTSLAANFRYTDPSNGFRGFRVEKLFDERISPLREAFLTYELVAFLPIRFGQLAMKIVEIPVSREYPKMGKVPTKIKGIEGHLRLLKILIKASLGRYSPGAGEDPA